MVSSTLGKRTRTSTRVPSPALKLSASKRVKISHHPDIFADENDHPLATKAAATQWHDEEPVDVDESTPAKHGAAGRRLAFSPPDIKTPSAAGRNSDYSRGIQTITPQTPRYRDALSKTVPITPRHRVMITGKPLTPRTPRTPVTPGGSVVTVYSRARQLFTRSTEPGRLVGREAEREELTAFVKECIAKISGGCTYVSGPPGTGKSAMVNEVTESVEASPTVKKAYINCMSMKTSKDLQGHLLENLCEGIEVLEGDEITTLQGMFVPRRRKDQTVYVVTLDEIDHILTLDLEITYKLFEWSLQKSSRLVLVGIANALDMTDRFLPRLKARNLKPQLLPFLPYSASQIKTVIVTRLKSLVSADSPTPDYVPFLHPAAVELCARKVSSQSGDLRKAFDICRRAIDLVEIETKQKHEQALHEQLLLESPSKKPLSENSNLASSPTTAQSVSLRRLAQSLSSLTVESAPRASISHVNKITSTTFGHGASQRLKALNLQQKAALCALVAVEKKRREAGANVLATPSKCRNAAPTVKALYDIYCKLCTQDAILHPLTSTEFRDVIGSLETLSLISAVDGRNGSFVGLTGQRKSKKFGAGAGVGDEKRVGSCVGEKEVWQAVEGLGAGILKNILGGEGLDY